MLVLIFKIVVANIELDLELDEKQNLQIKYSGEETDLVTDKDREAFDIEDHKLKDAVGSLLGSRPNDAYVKSPTPWGDLYKRYKWEEVERVLSIKSAKLKKMTKNPIIVMTEDFQNSSNRTITVNAGISHEVQNTITSTRLETKFGGVIFDSPIDWSIKFDSDRDLFIFAVTRRA
ncbi:hypothetical protein PYW07_010769 [Mythimna separata]|uniref:Uncharacterized protein n=1 Tax=Mythimna separata TaxID=271217 RepID=A0AAD8DL42_MYTSE|nr:hypothetical protein PYW07_010769 [Mythimna separata]